MQVTSSTAERSPFPSRGRIRARSKMGVTFPAGRDTSHIAASEALPDRGRVLAFTSAGGAKPNAGRGGLEGFTPPHRFKARTAAFDGHCAFTRAARQRKA